MATSSTSRSLSAMADKSSRRSKRTNYEGYGGAEKASSSRRDAMGTHTIREDRSAMASHGSSYYERPSPSVAASSTRAVVGPPTSAVLDANMATSSTSRSLSAMADKSSHRSKRTNYEGYGGAERASSSRKDAMGAHTIRENRSAMASHGSSYYERPSPSVAASSTRAVVGPPTSAVLDANMATSSTSRSLSAMADKSSHRSKRTNYEGYGGAEKASSSRRDAMGTHTIRENRSAMASHGSSYYERPSPSVAASSTRAVVGPPTTKGIWPVMAIEETNNASAATNEIKLPSNGKGKIASEREAYFVWLSGWGFDIRFGYGWVMSYIN